MKNLIILITLIIFTAVITSISQNDIQSWLSKVNSITSKHVEKLTDEDISFLKDVARMSSGRYGASMQKVVDDKKSDAEKILKNYEVWKHQQEKAGLLEKDLDEEKVKTQEQSQTIEAQSDTIIHQNMTIAELNQQVAKLRNDIKRLDRLNVKVKNEKANLQTVLDNNNEIVNRMKSLLTKNTDLGNNAPADVKADLENTECELALLLKTNFLLTIERLKKDTHTLDSLRNYYKETGKYPDQLEKYIYDGEYLANKFSSSKTECVNNNSVEIQNAIIDLKTLIEDTGGYFLQKALKFFGNNLFSVILVILLIISGVVILQMRNKMKKI